ncbi:uncharacterized mitochondrial protein AtMg01250-like [Helianthus annuus]|uniref:uncharacterized mitochondrial protein AtMg01250-like n=1 Tax=Helianthus annuus TaxID=4232 RepID=UPI000B9059E1|nr:uncharacterized mitochondrial protein AtMg01250-like [Helianthus annuus]
MGFPPKWCKWVMGILESARASVLVNGAPTFEFKCNKGLRQGDPISPFLFIVAMEALSSMLRKGCDSGVLDGIELPNNGLRISHLFYADDALIIGKWSRTNIMNVVRILRCFFVCSRLKINIGKSNLYGARVTSLEVVEVAEAVGCLADSLPFKYLGLTVGANMNRICNWRPVYDLFKKRFS